MKKNKTCFPFFRPYYSEPLSVKKASGTSIIDIDNREYLDCYAGVATLNLGHCHPEVDKAVVSQIAKFGHVSHIFMNPAETAYSEELLAHMAYNGLDASGTTDIKPGLTRLFFVNSGSEGVDLALCLARSTVSNTAEQKKTDPHRPLPLITALDQGYHGGSWLSKSATGLKTWHFPFGSSPNIDFALTPDSSDKNRVTECIRSLEKSFKKAVKMGFRPIFIMEPILGVGGIIIPPCEWFSRVRKLIKKYNVLLICDEVQTGFARCGTNLFGFQKFSLEPDIVVMGKAIANGYPLGAVASTDIIAESSRELLHFNTFGGHPASIAAAHMTLHIIMRDKLHDLAEKNGTLMTELLKKELAPFTGPDPKLSYIHEIRGTGYLIALEMHSDKQALQVMDSCSKNGLLIGIGGKYKNALRLEPALIFNKKEIEKTVKTLKNVFSLL